MPRIELKYSHFCGSSILKKSCLYLFLIYAEELAEKVSSDAVPLPESTDAAVASQLTNKSMEEIESEKNPVSKEIWIDYEDFCTCFQ